MKTARCQNRTRPEILRVDAPILPGWVCERFGETKIHAGCTADSKSIQPTDAVDVSIRRSGNLMLVTACVPNAVALAPLALQRRTTETYEAIRAQLTANKLWHPIRIWNLIPDIHGVMSDGIDRYMVFNAGRYAAYHDWYNGGAEFESSMATATGVGYTGKDLIVHVLADDRPGTPVENPRQVRAYRYSTRYGPMPPCFARATIAPRSGDGVGTLLIGGTSSVRGESSVHVGDVEAQTRETLLNIAHLIAAARHGGNGAARTASGVDTDAELRRFDSMRIYHTRAEHLNAILGVVWPCVDHLAPHRVDVVLAHLCRPDLLVEIEGTALID